MASPSSHPPKYDAKKFRTIRELVVMARRVVPWNRINMKFIESKEQLSKFKNANSFRVMWNPHGVRWVMIFAKRGKNYYSYFVERDAIFSPRPRVIAFALTSDISLYNGTVIEGTMVTDSSTKSQMFIMQDVYMLCGDKTRQDTWLDRMQRLTQEIDQKIKLDSVANRFEIAIDTGKSIAELRAMYEKGTGHLSWPTNGILFVPERSSESRWLFVESERKHNSASALTAADSESIAPPDGATTAVLEMHKSTLPQVYELWAADKKKGAGSKKHMGLAGIPTIAVSRFCTATFQAEEKRLKNADVKHVMMHCFYDVERENWVPFQHVPSRRSPDQVK